MNGAAGRGVQPVESRRYCSPAIRSVSERGRVSSQRSSKAVIPIRSAKVNARPKGRPVDPKALGEIRALLADSPRRRDLLIEYLHQIQDRYGHLSAAHLAALAAEMKMAQAEVYEVATFYHHFDVVKEGEAPPPALTVRVCDSLSCEMAGAKDLLARLPGMLGRDVRVIAAPCVGRCEAAPVAMVHQNPVGHATLEKVRDAVARKATRCPEPKYRDYAAYCMGKGKAGGYRLIADCLAGRPARRSRQSWTTPDCAGWAVRDSLPGASGRSSRRSPCRG